MKRFGVPIQAKLIARGEFTLLACKVLPLLMDALDMLAQSPREGS